MKYKTLILTLLLFTTALIAQAEDPSLVAHYKLSRDNYNAEKNYFIDLSGNGNHATPADTFQFVADHLGNSDGAMRFDGVKDYLNCGNDERFNLNTGEKTIMAWIILNTDDYSALYGKGQNAPYFYLYFNNTGYYNLASNQDGWTARGGEAADGLVFYNHAYHLFTMVLNFNTQKVKVYHNSIFMTEFSIADLAEMKSDDDFLIGTCIHDYFYKGAIEDFLLFNKTLSQKEIENHFGDNYPHHLNWGFENKRVFANDHNKWQSDNTPFHFSQASYDPSQVTVFPGNEKIKPQSGNFCLQHKCWEGAYRAEIRASGKTPNIGGNIEEGGNKSYQKNSEERWYSYYFYIPEDFDFNASPTGFYMTQLMSYGYYTTAPTYVIRIMPNGTLRADARLWATDSEGNTASQKHFGYHNPKRHKIETDQWHRIVLHVLSSADENGYFEGWLNGEPLLGANMEHTYTRYKEQDMDTYDRPEDTGYTYTYKIKNHRFYGQNIKHERKDELAFKVGYYRHDTNIVQSIYTDNFKIGKNAQSIGFDPDSPEPVKSNLDIANTNITFDETPKGQSKTDYLIIKNIGKNAVSILDILIADTTNYKIISFPDSNLSPGDSTAIEVLFSPQNKNKDNSIMVIYTNDVVQDSIAVQLQGKGVYPPELRINIPNRRR